MSWPEALRAVRGWLEPWVMLWRYWRAFGERSSPEDDTGGFRRKIPRSVSNLCGPPGMGGRDGGLRKIVRQGRRSPPFWEWCGSC